jgi:hypothetical protein
VTFSSWLGGDGKTICHWWCFFIFPFFSLVHLKFTLVILNFRVVFLFIEI